jgi:glycosyltransferase involved in cell wall biosynthesis
MLASAAVAAMQCTHDLIGTWGNHVDRFIAPSALVRSLFLAAGFSSESIELKPHFVPVDLGPSSGGGGYALYVGRLSPEKGITPLLEAWRCPPAGLPLHIVGDGPLADLVRAHQASNASVTWLGPKRRTEVLDLMGQAEVLVAPTIAYESFHLSLIEALSRGLPIIASDRGTAREIVEARKTGILVQPGSAEALKQAVSDFLDSHDRDAMRRACRAAFEARFTAAVNLPRQLEVYFAALAARSKAL